MNHSVFSDIAISFQIVKERNICYTEGKMTENKILMEAGQMDIIFERAEPDKKDVLFRLLQYSLYEESMSDQNEINEDALFEYPWFDRYFTEIGREAYFIREKGTDKLLGFVMINTHVQKCGEGHSIAEFMVLPKFRRNKIGKKAAAMCFDMHGGNWEVSPSYGSRQAYLFWKNVIEGYADGKVRYEDGIFLFSNHGRA